MNVSVIVPAHNAAATIAETLESLRAQTHTGWEAIVVDDGSSDDTVAVAACLAEQDTRIHTVSQSHQGVSTARNKGISLARFEWLLFLDADDWLTPTHLKQMTHALNLNPEIDAVHCGWVRVAVDGRVIGREEFCTQAGDLFPDLARTCLFAIHACIVRRSLVQAVGGFDPSLRVCEDWDLWQRIARAGARFGVVRKALAYYLVRPDSASRDGFQFLTGGLHVLIRGHSPDARVPNPAAAYASGMPVKELPDLKFFLACYCAGLILGRGEDARPVLSALKNDYVPDLDPYDAATSIFQAVVFSTCRTPDAWVELWPRLELGINEFLSALETRVLIPGLARRTCKALESLVIKHSTLPRPLTIGATHAVRVEVTEPISDVRPTTSAERLECMVELEGAFLGMLELPVCDRFVPHQVLADAIACEFAWLILGRFFECTVYRDLHIARESTGLVIKRGSLRLVEGLPEDEYPVWPQVHEQIGWTVFLQEIWGLTDWPSVCFYDPQARCEEHVARRKIDQGWLAIEVSEELPALEVSGQELHVVLMVAGVALGVVTIPVEHNIVAAQELRAALTTASGFELCRAAVREGLLGRPISESVTLRARLARAATTTTQHGQESLALEIPAPVVGTPGSAEGLIRTLSPRKRGVVLGRRIPAVMGTSASRWAALPAAALPELLDAARAAGEPVFQVPEPSEQAECTVYAPTLVGPPFQHSQVSCKDVSKAGVTQSADAVPGDRGYFETLFALKPDPWKYTSPYEQTKYEQTLALLPSAQIGRALELACAEGHFTVQLAPRVSSLIAADISQVALDRAAQRCASLQHIRFERLDLVKDPLPGRFELIVCSEMLYYVGGHEMLRAVARKLVDALEPGGYLLMANPHLVVDEPDRPGFDWDLPFGAKVISETFASTSPLQLSKELRTPLYRVQLFQHELPAWRYSSPEIIELEQPTPLLPEVAEHVLWHGGCPRRNGTAEANFTDRLPILMYHRVAPTGSSVMARYRLTPEAFAEQLQYLRDAGFYSVTLENWRAAMAAKKPLPGRAVLLTFDDGYLDFLTHAWPLLKHYGFSATVFLVAEKIGASNSWDQMYDEKIPLLGWKEIHQLQNEGFEFGSHSASHRLLTALSPVEVVREAARSRAILGRELGVPIKAFAYPYGNCDGAVRHLIGACGYVFGLSCQPALSRFQDPPLALPRIEVTGSDSLREFIAKLTGKL
jgi:peptidoglycan/xylan/chitin deacetylase (PgdA/CDA1 family)